MDKRVSDLLCMSNSVHASSTKEHEDNDDYEGSIELLSNLVFEGFGSCGDLVWFGGFNSVFERDACDDFCEVVKAA